MRPGFDLVKRVLNTSGPRSVKPEPPSEEPAVPGHAETDPPQTQEPPRQEAVGLESVGLSYPTEKTGEDEAPSRDDAPEDDKLMPSPPE